MIVDPVADIDEAKHEYNLTFNDIEDVKDMDVVVFAVGHEEFKSFSVKDIDTMYKDGNNQSKVLIDVKGIYDKSTYQDLGYRYWRL